MLHQYIRDYGFGLLIVADEHGIEANHLPFQLCCEGHGPLGLLRCHVARMNEPWAVGDAPSDFTERLVQTIVGIEIEIKTLTGKLKASQNQPERNRTGVKAGLETRECAHGRAMSKFIN